MPFVINIPFVGEIDVMLNKEINDDEYLMDELNWLIHTIFEYQQNQSSEPQEKNQS